MKRTPVLTTCTLDCTDNCSVVCNFEAGGAGAGGAAELTLRGNPDHPFTRGFTCAKIRRYPGRLASPERIVQPHVRRGDAFVAVSWDDAFDTILPALTAALEADPATVLFMRRSGSVGLTKSYADYLFGALGARTTGGALCEAAGGAAIVADTGALRMNHPRTIEDAEALVLWGKHPRACSIHMAAQVLDSRRRHIPVLAVNPDAGSVANIADRTICPRAGTDRFLALAALKLLLERGPEHISRAVPWDLASNALAFRALLDRMPLPDLLRACDVGEADARFLAATYAATPRVATLVGWGIQRYLTGGETVRALHALAFLAGTLTVPGGGFYYDVSSSRHLRHPQPAPWRIPLGCAGPHAAAPPLQLALLGEELATADPPVRFLWEMCGNPVNQIPDSAAVRRGFAAIPTRVIVDGYWTDTAREATVVLPPALWLEEEDVAASFWQPWLGLARRVVEPPPGCRSDFDILQELGHRLGFPTEYRTRDAWLSARLPEGGPTLDRLRQEGFVETPEPDVAWADGFAHPDGRFRLLDHLTSEPPLNPERPLRLLSLVRRGAMHSQMLPSEQEDVLEARFNPETARALGLEDGGAAVVESAVGRLQVRVRLDPGLHPGAVACPRDGWIGLGLGPNVAHVPAVADLGGQAAYYSTEVSVRPMAADEAEYSPSRARGPVR